MAQPQKQTAAAISRAANNAGSSNEPDPNTLDAWYQVDQPNTDPWIQTFNSAPTPQIQSQALNELSGMIPTTTVDPSLAPIVRPVKFSQQIQLYVNGATKKLFIYDTTNNNWLQVALT